ncbi:MAG: hypothetical protein ACERKX_09370, partial [Anaerolineales bacterium]
HQDASNGAVCHAEIGAQMAKPIVTALPLTEKQKENIVHCIRSHRFRGIATDLESLIRDPEQEGRLWAESF